MTSLCVGEADVKQYRYRPELNKTAGLHLLNISSEISSVYIKVLPCVKSYFTVNDYCLLKAWERPERGQLFIFLMTYSQLWLSLCFLKSNKNLTINHYRFLNKLRPHMCMHPSGQIFVERPKRASYRATIPYRRLGGHFRKVHGWSCQTGNERPVRSVGVLRMSQADSAKTYLC